MEIPTNVLLIFLGSILTFLSTWAVESLKNKKELEEKRKNFKLLTKQEFAAALKGLEKLKTILELRNYFDTYALTQLEKNVSNLEGYKSGAIFLSSQEQQELFIDLITTLSTYSIDARGLQQLYWDESKRIKEGITKSKSFSRSGGEATKELNSKELEDYFNRRKTEKSIELIEIKRQISDFLKSISN